MAIQLKWYGGQMKIRKRLKIEWEAFKYITSGKISKKHEEKCDNAFNRFLDRLYNLLIAILITAGIVGLGFLSKHNLV